MPCARFGQSERDIGRGLEPVVRKVKGGDDLFAAVGKRPEFSGKRPNSRRTLGDSAGRQGSRRLRAVVEGYFVLELPMKGRFGLDKDGPGPGKSGGVIEQLGGATRKFGAAPGRVGGGFYWVGASS